MSVAPASTSERRMFEFDYRLDWCPDHILPMGMDGATYRPDYVSPAARDLHKKLAIAYQRWERSWPKHTRVSPYDVTPHGESRAEYLLVQVRRKHHLRLDMKAEHPGAKRRKDFGKAHTKHKAVVAS